MLSKVVKSIFGSRNDRELKRMGKLVKKINDLETSFEALTDEELKNKTAEFRERVNNKGETLDGILPEAFAVVREAGKRVLGMRHFDVQMIGGITLHEGKIAEMRTGEGKTLMSTLPCYLNAISGHGVHVVTVNDYLATRDANWMKPLFESLGLSVGVIQSMQYPQDKRDAYNADITYGTNNEFGFDYLRDNMAMRKEDRMQKALNFAIVDEVDSILIDEARTPLIISGQAEDSSELYRAMNKLIPNLKKQELDEKGETPEDITGHYTIDEKSRQVELTELGHQLVEDLLAQNGLLKEGDSLYSPANLSLVHHVHSALKAHTLFNRNIEYIVQEDQVVLIDEHTGRTMPGRRLSEGLHQAIEAKEGVKINAESQTLASTTFQNYFRLYPKLSGMTGTADTEAFELKQIYNLEVVVVPPNRTIQRKDLNDLVYLSIEDKFNAIVEDVKAFQEKNAPVLVGTASVETSEAMSERLKKAGIKHQVLNAKHHEREAEIISQAGRPGAVTIATNMAGRGTDIVLGGSWEAEVALLEEPTDEQIAKIKEEWKKRHEIVLEAGGLHIIGSERHESRRIDNQLRGRAGRQGDPGLSRFYLSLEDPLMRIFASERVQRIMQAMGMEKGEAIEARMVTNAIEKAQRKVEARNFDYRKHVLEFDDVANDQRRVIYAQRNDLLEAEEISGAIAGIREDVINQHISHYVPPQSVAEQWDVPGLERSLESEFSIKLPIQQWLDEDKKLYEDPLREKILAGVEDAYKKKEEEYGDIMQVAEKHIMLQVLDNLWKEHLQTMDHLRQGINLRAYAQKNPKQEYKRESFELFQQLLDNLKFEVTQALLRLEITRQDDMERAEQAQEEKLRQQKITMQHDEVNAMGENGEPEIVAADRPYSKEGKKVGRNDLCPCGSGKKFKACHGKLNA